MKQSKLSIGAFSILLFLMIGGGVGLCLGLAAYKLTPRVYQASALIRIDYPVHPYLYSSPNVPLEDEVQTATSPAVIALFADKISGLSSAEIAQSLQAVFLPQTTIIRITAHTTSPALAAQIADLDAAALVQYDGMILRQMNAANDDPLLTQIARTRATISSLQNQITNLAASNSTSPEIASLQAQLTQMTILYSNLTSQLLQQEVQEAQNAPVYSIVQEADAASAQRTPSLRTLSIAGTLVGMVLALLLIAYRYRRGRTIFKPRDIPKRLTDAFIYKAPLTSPLARDAEHRDTGWDETLRMIAMDISIASAEHPMKLLAVVSLQHADTQESMRVTTTLAEYFAENQRPVLLVDAALASPKLHQYYQTANASGLAEAVLNHINDPEAFVPYVQPTFVPALYLLTAGHKARYERQLLSTPALRGVFDAAEAGAAEVIIVRSPSLQKGRHALSLLQMMDGVFLVVVGGKTGLDQLRYALSEIREYGIDLLGILLLSLPEARRDAPRSRPPAKAARDDEGRAINPPVSSKPTRHA